jgi:hypothetical protein
MRDAAYAAFSALDPFFDIVRQGLAGFVDGDHDFNTIASDAVFEFRYRFPCWPTKLVDRCWLAPLSIDPEQTSNPETRLVQSGFALRQKRPSRRAKIGEALEQLLSPFCSQ